MVRIYICVLDAGAVGEGSFVYVFPPPMLNYDILTLCVAVIILTTTILLLFTGIITYMPSRVMVMHARAKYYLFGGVARRVGGSASTSAYAGASTGFGEL